MKAAGIIILYVGMLMTVYTGFTYITREKVGDVRVIEIIGDSEHNVDWHPSIGIGLMIFGGAALVFGSRGSSEA
jgi:hypothetical protein